MAMATKVGKAFKSKSKPNVRMVEYSGRHAKTGNSAGFRFEAALFKSHPEFSGRVTARVVAPGQLLVTVPEQEPETDRVEETMWAFLGLLGRDMEAHPEKIRPLDEEQMNRIGALVGHIKVDLNENLGEEDLLA